MATTTTAMLALYQLSSLTRSYVFSTTAFHIISLHNHNDFLTKGINNRQQLTTSITSLFLNNDDEARSSDIEAIKTEQIPNDLGLEIIRGGGDALSDEIWREIEEGAPSKLDVMKSVSTMVLHYLLMNGSIVHV